MALRHATNTGMAPIAQYTARLQTTLEVIMSVILTMGARYATGTFTVQTVQHAALQSKAIKRDIMTATLRMAVRLAMFTGMDQTVVCTAKRGMTLRDITSAIGWMGVGAVWTIGTAPSAPNTASHETQPRDITPVTQRLEPNYVFQAGLGSSVTIVSSFYFRYIEISRWTCLTK